MKQDKDLAFLATCKNEDLRTLCDILTYNKKGELRLSEQLTNSDAYIHCYPERMNMMTKEISEEIRKYGSNTVKTLYRRGEADNYDTILRRVCKRMSVVVGYDDWSINFSPMSVKRLPAISLMRNCAVWQIKPVFPTRT